MNICLLDNENLSEWDTFVQSFENATFYHHSLWKSVIEESFGHHTYYASAKNGSNIEGILPLVQLKSALFGNILCSMPFLNYGGICSKTANGEAALAAYASKLMKDLGANYVELRQPVKLNNDLPFSTHKVSMVIDLAPNPDEVWERFKSKHRNNIKRSLKSGFEIRWGRDDKLLLDFYGLISLGWRNMGTPVYQHCFFQKIVDAFQECVEIAVVYLEGHAVAAAFNGIYKERVEGMWTYASRDFAKLNPNYFLYWKMIENACERGMKSFHLGRSTADGAGAEFKEKWMANQNQLYWQYVLREGSPIPQLNVENRKYDLARNVWKKIPVGIASKLGPRIAKYIP